MGVAPSASNRPTRPRFPWPPVIPRGRRDGLSRGRISPLRGCRLRTGETTSPAESEAYAETHGSED